MHTDSRFIYSQFLLLLIGFTVFGQSLFGQLMPRSVRTFANVPGVNLNASAILEDRQGSLWLATDDGIARYDGRQFRVYHDPLIGKGDDYFQAVPSVDGKVWLRSGLGRSLAYVDTRQQKIIRIPDSSRVVREFVAKQGMNRVFVDPQGTLWIGLSASGMIRVDPKTLAVEPVFREPVTVRGITQTADGRVWMATEQGLRMYDPVRKRTKAFRHDPRNTNSLGSDYLVDIGVRQNGQLLIGMSDEVDIFEPVTETFRRLPLQKHLVPGASYPNLFSKDQQGTDYFLTAYSAYRYNDRDGLQRLEFPTPGERLWALHVDKANQLWISSQNKLRQYDLTKTRRLPALTILDVLVDGVRLTETTDSYSFSRSAAGKLSLTIYEDKPINIHYILSPLRQVTRSRCRLIPYERDWMVRVEAATNLSYSLSRGRYTFIISRSRDNGTWENDVEALSIEVKPLFYNTWWLRLLLILVVAGGGYFLIRTYFRRQQMRQELALKEVEAMNLRNLDELKSQFFANITHELRTPLTLILHATEQLAGRPTDAWRQKRLVTIRQNADQLTRLIGEMLDISRMDAHKLEVYAKVGNPVSFLEQQVLAFVELAAKKQIQLTFMTRPSGNLEQDGRTCVFDDDKLGKIIYNLLSNALKFTPEGGSVGVGCELTTSQHLIIRVQDSGIGIAADQLPRIFERFYQADSSSTRRYEGSGIGLAYVKELTELMGGQVTAESILRAGSTFTVTIPVEDVVTPSAEPAPVVVLPPVSQSVSQHVNVSPPVVVTTASKPLVLIVEDNLELRTYIAGQLRQHYQLLEAADGREGITQALRAIPDLIVSDVMMPFVDGYELVRTLKNDERTSHIPIVMLTAKSSFDSKMHGLEQGADDYVGKPFSFAELNTRIRNGISTRQHWQHYLTASITSVPTTPTPAAPAGNSSPDKEKQFLTRLRQSILNHLTDETIDVEWLVTQAGMSRTQLHRKLTALTNLNTTGFIHSVRLEKARELLQTTNLTVAEVSYQVGYSSPAYFSKVFSDHFGHSPANDKV